MGDETIQQTRCTLACQIMIINNEVINNWREVTGHLKVFCVRIHGPAEAPNCLCGCCSISTSQHLHWPSPRGDSSLSCHDDKQYNSSIVHAWIALTDLQFRKYGLLALLNKLPSVCGTC